MSSGLLFIISTTAVWIGHLGTAVSKTARSSGLKF